MESFESSDFVPFRAGIEAKAPFVLVSHNVVSCMDPDAPASLSPAVHEILREELGFTGLILTDDLVMDAVTDFTGGKSAAVQAFLAGNDLLLSSDCRNDYQALYDAVESGEVRHGHAERGRCACAGGKICIGDCVKLFSLKEVSKWIWQT